MKKLLISMTIVLLGLSASAQTGQEKICRHACDSCKECIQGKTCDKVCDSCKCDSCKCCKQDKVREWYAGVSGGVQVFTGMTDRHLSFGKTIAPVGGVTFGRYLNNWLSVDLNLTVAQFKGLYTRPVLDKHFATDRCFDLGTQRYYQDGVYMQLYARAGFDLNTIIAGYKPDRKLSVVPYVGGGIASGLGKALNDVSNFAIAPTIDYGVELQINFCPLIAGIVDIHGNGVGLQLENEGCTEHSLHASYGARLGVRFNLGHLTGRL